jgi:hypothetical protein
MGSGQVQFMRLVFFIYFASFSLLLLSTSAEAHGARGGLPIGRVAEVFYSRRAPHLFSSQLNQLLNGARIPGLSGSQSAFLIEKKTLSAKALISGIVQEVNSGNIGSGQIYATGYQQLFGAPVAAVFPGTFVALGSNPLNGPTGARYIIPFPGNFASFTYAAVKQPGTVRPTMPALRLSGAQQIGLNQLKGLVSVATAAGRNVALTGLTGGFLSGTGYAYLGGTTFEAGATNGFAFGNSPLNVQPSFPHYIAVYPNQSNYLNFLNKINIPVSSFQIAGTAYQGGRPPTPLIFRGFTLVAGGMNPLYLGQRSRPAFMNIGAPYTIPAFIRLKLLNL